MEDVSQTDEAFDRRLRDAAPYIEDAGFTARVLQQLPAPRPKAKMARPFILLGMTGLASFLVYVLSDGGRFLLVEMVRLTALPPLWMGLMVAGCGFLLMTGGCVAALSKTARIGLS